MELKFSTRMCPMCTSENISTERRMNGDSKCLDCGHGASSNAFNFYEVNEKIDPGVTFVVDLKTNGRSLFSGITVPENEMSGSTIYGSHHVKINGSLYDISFNTRINAIKLSE